MANTDHEELQIELASLLEEARTTMPDECCCIYRVPNDIRGINEDSFTPKLVSIGPFHYCQDPRLQKMQKYKSLFHEQFCQRISSTVSSDALISFVEGIEPSVRLHYSERIELSNKEFVKVILLDSCFIFELFLRSYHSDWDGLIDFKPWETNTIKLDMLLFENQLPFPELEGLFTRIFPSSDPSFRRLTSHFFILHNNTQSNRQDVSISHFIDLIRTSYLPPPSNQPGRSPKSVTHLPCATRLAADAGLKFRRSRSRSPSLLDLKFSGRVLEMPGLVVDDWTETLFRNLVALEQCHYPSDPYITDYVAIMDFLINTGNDVDLLVQAGVINNLLGDSISVANLFNSLWKNVKNVNFNSHYAKICNDLNAFCESPWNNMKATLRQDYCKTPWQTAASIAGILLLLLTLIQAVCSVLQVLPQYKNNSSH